MNITIHQKQSSYLLEEHATSSFNYTFIGRNELFLAIATLLLGLLIASVSEKNWLMGLPFVVIGMLEIIKYPNREQRWVKKKEKEALFNKTIVFTITNDSLTIKYDDKEKEHPFTEMRKCLVSEKGVLFKISRQEYYYLSFKSFKNPEALINKLIAQFPHDQLSIKKVKNIPPN